MCFAGDNVRNGALSFYKYFFLYIFEEKEKMLMSVCCYFQLGPTNPFDLCVCVCGPESEVDRYSVNERTVCHNES